MSTPRTAKARSGPSTRRGPAALGDAALRVLAVLFVAIVYWRENANVSRRYRIVLATLRLTIVGLLLLMIAQLTLSLSV